MREAWSSTKLTVAMKVKVVQSVSLGRTRSLGAGALLARLVLFVGEAEQERTRWDPKDGELCLSRTKPEETLVEVRSDSDVQIDCRSWV